MERCGWGFLNGLSIVLLHCKGWEVMDIKCRPYQSLGRSWWSLRVWSLPAHSGALIRAHHPCYRLQDSNLRIRVISNPRKASRSSTTSSTCPQGAWRPTATSSDCSQNAQRREFRSKKLCRSQTIGTWLLYFWEQTNCARRGTDLIS